MKLLLENDPLPFGENPVTAEVLAEIDNLILHPNPKEDFASDETIGIYKKFSVMKQNAPEPMKQELFSAIRNYAKEKINSKMYVDALLMLRFLIVKSKLLPQSYYDIAEILFYTNQKSLSETFLEYYRQTETNIPLKLLSIANFYNMLLKDYKSAIKYYEQYIKIEETKPVIFTTLGSLYKKAYGDKSLKEQIYYFEKAHNLKPDDRLSLHCLAFDYEKLGDRVNADKYYKKLLENNPTDTDYYNYGGFLISCGKFHEGHKFLTHRFMIDDINLQYPKNLDIIKKWDFKTDLSDKTLLIHYEQGFGDTFMYCRFVPLMKKLAGKIIFVVQDEVLSLIKSSKKISEGIEVISDKTDISTINYDYNMALLDCPYVLNTESENLPYAEQYLDIPQEKIEEYKNKYIKNTPDLKVGVAYKGSSTANYNSRDIEYNKLSVLFNLENIDFYSFNMENENSQKVVNLSETFNDFTNTACALKNMDFVVSTDNVILNLAGALGVKTYALFNKYPNFRWFKLSGNDTGWYKSVVPFQAEEENLWFPQISNIINELKQTVNC